MENKESICKTFVYYPFRLIASIMSALSMDDKGLSLKKIVTAFSTWEAAVITNKEVAPNNVIILVVIWLVYAGISMGIYSLKDISNSVSQIKNTGNKPKDETSA